MTSVKSEEALAASLDAKRWLERKLQRVNARIETLNKENKDITAAWNYKSDLENRLYIRKGDTATITHKGWTYTGEVLLSDRDYLSGTYNIEIDVKEGTASLRGYTYWKQAIDGGTISKEWK